MKKLQLESLERLGWRFGLQSIQALLAELGNPQGPLRVIHVAGSNGKGSTCAFTASLLKHLGYKTGFYSSPHLCDVRERFRVNGEWISRGDFNRLSQKVLAACQKVESRLGHLPTHFEALTALAFCWFKEKRVDYLVLEVGLGGRLDATNLVARPAACLIAPISLEHQDILGKTVRKIAWEKAGILKRGCPAATLQTYPGASREIEKVARQKGAPLWIAGRDFKFRKEPGGFYWEGPGLSAHFKLPGFPDYQAPNAALAIAGIQLISPFPSTGEGVIQKALTATRWPGRMEEISRKPLVLLDGAHNPEAARVLAGSLGKRYPNRRWTVLNGFLGDKDHGGFIRALAPLVSFSIVTEPESDRKKSGEAVFQAWEKAGVRAAFVKDWQQALGLAMAGVKKGGPQAGLLVTGSFYLIGSCREKLVGLRGLEKI